MSLYSAYETCPSSAPVFGFAGAALAVILSVIGAGYGTFGSAKGLFEIGKADPDKIFKNLMPIIMSGVLGIYGLVCAVIINGRIPAPSNDGATQYSLYTAYAHLAAGLCVGGSSLASGVAIGVSSDAAMRAIAIRSQKGGNTFVTTKNDSKGADQLFVGTTVILVFASNVATYGFIVAMMLSQMEFLCGE